MATIENFIIKVKTEGAGAIRTLADDMQDLALNSSPVGGALGNIAGKLGPLSIAATAAASAFAAMGMKALQLAGDLEDIAGATGLSTGQINTFAGSLIAAGGKMDDAQQILGKLNQSINEAASGNENLQKAFQNLGVFVTDANGKVRSTGDILNDITNRFKSGELTSSQYAAAIDILGKNVNRLELSKLSAADDPAITAATKNIDRFNDEIDKLNKLIRDNLILTFGAFAKAVNEGGISGGIAKITESIGNLAAEILNLPTDAIAGFLNLFGANIQNPVGLGTPLKKLVEQAKKDREAFQAEQVALKKAKDEADKLAASQNKPPASNQPMGPQGGGFGAVPEATLKAIEESRNRIRMSGIERERLTQLRALDDIGNIEINKRAEIEKAIAEIKNRERLTDAQKQAEIVAKTAEIEARAQNDINNLRANGNKALADGFEQYKLSLFPKQREIELTQQMLGLSLQEQAKRRQLLEIEREMLIAIEKARQVRNADPRQVEETIKQIEAQAEAMRQMTIANAEYQNSFAAGWERAFTQFMDNATNASRIAENIFSAMTSNMNSALDRFVETGKVNFRDLTQSIIQDILKIQLRAAAANLFAQGSNFFSSLFTPRAIGGPVSAGQPYLVGERGVEAFFPATAGTIVPNNKLGGLGGGGNTTYITNNISAIDSKSVAQLFAENRQTLFGNVEQARRELPLRTR